MHCTPAGVSGLALFLLPESGSEFCKLLMHAWLIITKQEMAFLGKEVQLQRLLLLRSLPSVLTHGKKSGLVLP